VGLLGSEFAPITYALVTFFAVVFSVLYGILEFVGADLWDEDFTKALECILLNCATNVDGVVTFDWECFNNALAAQVTIVDLTFEQLRLFGQIEYLLLVIGGVDALNTAGATTAITDDDCSFCEAVWCYHFDADNQLGDWVVHAFGGDTVATYDGTKWLCTGTPPNTSIWISWTLGTATVFTDAAILEWTPPVTAGDELDIWANGDGTVFSGTKIWSNGFAVGSPFPITITRLDVTNLHGFATVPRTLSALQFSGLGDNPFGVDNC